MKKITQRTKNRKNRNFAIPAAAVAIPVNPSNAAISAITKKMTAHLNISIPPLINDSCQLGPARVSRSERINDFTQQRGPSINVTGVNLEKLRTGSELLTRRLTVEYSAAGNDR